MRIPSGDQRKAIVRRIEREAGHAASLEIHQPDVTIALRKPVHCHALAIGRQLRVRGLIPARR